LLYQALKGYRHRVQSRIQRDIRHIERDRERLYVCGWRGEREILVVVVVFGRRASCFFSCFEDFLCLWVLGSDCGKAVLAVGVSVEKSKAVGNPMCEEICEE